jgi:hypothetical protein
LPCHRRYHDSLVNRSHGAATLPLLAALLGVLLAAAPAAAYRIILKDGSTLAAREKYHVDGDRAIVVLESGATTSLRVSEIDLERTEQANQRAYGRGATVIDAPDPAATGVEGRADGSSLQEFIRSRPARDPGATTARVSQLRLTAAGFVDLVVLPRQALPDAERTEAISTALRAKGLGSFEVWAGSAPGRVLVELVAEHKDAVLEGLVALAMSYVELQEQRSAPEAFEVLMRTSKRSRAGMFALDGDNAPLLAKGRLDPGEFYLQYVEF